MPALPVSIGRIGPGGALHILWGMIFFSSSVSSAAYEAPHDTLALPLSICCLYLLSLILELILIMVIKLFQVGKNHHHNGIYYKMQMHHK